MIESLLEAKQVTRVADGQSLLDSVSLSLRFGERVALVGASGSGKSLLLRALAMLDSIDAGGIRWRGSELGDRDIPKYRGQSIYLHQRPILIEGTVAENLQHPFSFSVHRGKTFKVERIVSYLECLGRDASFLDRPVTELSGGEAQIAALLRAIQLEPTVLLLDEPSAALDRELTKQVENLVATWFDRLPGQRGYIWVTHDELQAERVSDRVLEMASGKLR